MCSGLKYPPVHYMCSLVCTHCAFDKELFIGAVHTGSGVFGYGLFGWVLYLYNDKSSYKGSRELLLFYGIVSDDCEQFVLAVEL